LALGFSPAVKGVRGLEEHSPVPLLVKQDPTYSKILKATAKFKCEKNAQLKGGCKLEIKMLYLSKSSKSYSKNYN
jgi:hypothetical protein